jgi:hypothetical protein
MVSEALNVSGAVLETKRLTSKQAPDPMFGLSQGRLSQRLIEGKRQWKHYLLIKVVLSDGTPIQALEATT